MSKSILKTINHQQKGDNTLKSGGDRAKSVKLDIDAIDEDSSESSVAESPSSQHKLSQKETGAESSSLQLNVQRVKFDA